jgi:hypothetical protein
MRIKPNIINSVINKIVGYYSATEGLPSTNSRRCQLAVWDPFSNTAGLCIRLFVKRYEISPHSWMAYLQYAFINVDPQIRMCFI